MLVAHGGARVDVHVDEARPVNVVGEVEGGLATDESSLNNGVELVYHVQVVGAEAQTGNTLIGYRPTSSGQQ